MNAVIEDRVISPPAAEPRVSHWRVALVLGAATGVAAMLVIPYVLAATGSPTQTRGLPPAAVFALGGVQSTVLGFLVAWAGLRLGAPLGLDAPLVRAWVSRTPFRGPAHWGKAAMAGVLAGGAIVLLIQTIFTQAPLPATAGHPTRWQGALASFYGGIGEEVQLRLFFMTLVAWCLVKLTRRRAPAVFFAAIVVAALVFGAGHLPLAAQVFGPLTTMIVLRTVLLNALAGLAFGALYWRWGLEHAIVAHFCADIVLHVVLAA